MKKPLLANAIFLLVFLMNYVLREEKGAGVTEFLIIFCLGIFFGLLVTALWDKFKKGG